MVDIPLHLQADILGPQVNELGAHAAAARIGVVSVGAEQLSFSDAIADVYRNSEPNVPLEGFEIDSPVLVPFHPDDVWFDEPKYAPTFHRFATIDAEDDKFSVLSGEISRSEFVRRFLKEPVLTDTLNIADLMEEDEGWGEFKSTFDGMPKDPYVDPENPINRRRRYGEIELVFDTRDKVELRLIPNQVFESQHPDQTNQYLFDTHPKREFEPLSPELLNNDVFQQIVMAFVDRLPSHVNNALRKSTMKAKVMVQQFDVRTNPDGTSSAVTPEGDLISEYPGYENCGIPVKMHSDAMDFVGVILVDSSGNLQGGEAYTARLNGINEVGMVTLRKPGQMYFLNEMGPDESGRRELKVVHGLTPIYTNDGREGYRRVLILNICIYEPEVFFQSCSDLVDPDVIKAAYVPFQWPCDDSKKFEQLCMPYEGAKLSA